MNPELGQVIGGRYELTRRIAVGGMGEVWQATDGVLHRDVAVKLLKAEYSTDSTFLARFRAEARHAAALSHPNIAGVYDYADTGDVAYLVMELVPGEPLNTILGRTGALPAREVMVVLAATARGLGAAHAGGVVHRDVKPGNILITPNGDVKITDFGIARAGDSVPLTQTGQVMGTAQYLAPEQASGQQVTGASDLYSLGVVGFEALMGKRPFDGESPVSIAMAHVNNPAPELPEHFSPGTRALIKSALAKDPAERPGSAAIFAQAADLIADGKDAEAIALLPGDNNATSVLPPMGNAPAVNGPATTPMNPAAMAAASPPMTQGNPGQPGTPTQGGYYQPQGQDTGNWNQQPYSTGNQYAADYEEPRGSNIGVIIGIASLVVVALLGVIMVVLLTNGGGDNEAATTPTETTSASETTEPEETTTTQEDEEEEEPVKVNVDSASLTGADVDEVVQQLEAMGLQISRESVESDLDKGTVVRLNPSGSLDRGTAVTVYYSKGPKPKDNPTVTPTEKPSDKPTDKPTRTPTDKPTDEPEDDPTDKPEEPAPGEPGDDDEPGGNQGDERLIDQPENGAGG